MGLVYFQNTAQYCGNYWTIPIHKELMVVMNRGVHGRLRRIFRNTSPYPGQARHGCKFEAWASPALIMLGWAYPFCLRLKPILLVRPDAAFANSFDREGDFVWSKLFRLRLLWKWTVCSFVFLIFFFLFHDICFFFFVKINKTLVSSFLKKKKKKQLDSTNRLLKYKEYLFGPGLAWPSFRLVIT